ncbi:DUF1697 domain-containing protein [uncultured Shewanella sp.]|uniref:DUF1697 domain-containing protein n=1 Tax=uncultured Shewanella sp. TaxID=173975 RepID=UPI0026243053|nr:DUF1697 domain-containing protein [uncultured Shewanella sp.]
MQTFIVLLKGINVGGNNLLPMKDFVAQLKKVNYESVSSYIQSGNIVLKSTANPTKNIQSLVLNHYGFTPEIFVFTESTFVQSSIHNPFNECDGKCVHFYFCQNNIELVQEKIDTFLAETEQYTVKGNIFYLYAPNGIGRSKLVANIEACLGQKATGRNLNTINNISSMVKNT